MAAALRDTDRIGFRDEVFYQNWEQTDEGKADFGEELEREMCLKLFDDYEKMEHIIY